MIHTESIGPAPDATTRENESEWSTLGFLIVLARHKRFILRFTLGAVVVAVIASLLLPIQYTAETLVLPPSQNSSSGASALMSQLSGVSGLASLAGGGFGLKNQSEMYVSLLKSRTVEDAMIQRFGLMGRYKAKRMSAARKAFEDHSTVVLGAKDGLIRITIDDGDPQRAADMANGYVEEFRKLSAKLAITEASQRRVFFEQQLQEAKNNLTVAEEAMKNTEQSTGVLQIDSQARSLIEAASNLRAQIVAKQVQIQGMRSFATDENPELLMAKQQLVALEAQLGKLAGSDQGSKSEFIVPKGRVPEAGMEYIRKFRDLKYRETVYELIAKQFEIAKLDEARQGAIIQVADPAVPPDRKSSPKRMIIVTLAMLIAFAISVVKAVISESFVLVQRDPARNCKMRTLRELLFEKR